MSGETGLYRLLLLRKGDNADTLCNLPLPRITQTEKYVSFLREKTTKLGYQ